MKDEIMMSGREMFRYLVSLGIGVQKVVRKRQTGDYVADFYVPELHAPVPSARVWALRLQQIMPGVTILATHDIVAPWRAGCPIIYATVVFRLAEQEAA